MNLDELIGLGLPNLQSITLGNYALFGNCDSLSCSLIMRSMNEAIIHDRI